MAAATRVNVGTTPTKLADNGSNLIPLQVVLVNVGSASVDIGDATVTSGGGVPLLPNGDAALTLTREDPTVYAVAASGTVAVAVLTQREHLSE